MKSELQRIRALEIAVILLFPAFITLYICVIVYPGFMSYDTIHALDGANFGVTESTWPPMVSYIWRFVNIFSTSPSAMQCLQVYVLLTSVMAIVFLFVRKIWISAISIVVYLFVPVILGTVIVIWKDVLTASFMLAAFALVLVTREISRRGLRIFLYVASICFLFLGATTRHNSISGVLPMALYLAWMFFSSNRLSKILRVTIAVGLGLLLTGGLYGGKTLLDRYALPSFQQMAGTEDFLPVERILDLGGASICAGKNLFSTSAPNLSLAAIQTNYDARHVNLSSELIRQVPLGQELTNDWVNALISEPWCMTYQKRQTTKYLLGINKGDQFLITDPGITQNRYGYVLIPSSARDNLVNYIVSQSQVIIFRPWFLELGSALSLLALVLLRRRLQMSKEQLLQLSTLFVSGLFYLAGLILLGNAADARLPFYSNTTSFLIFFIALSKVCQLAVDRAGWFSSRESSAG